MIATRRLTLVELPLADHLRLACGESPQRVAAPGEMMAGPDAVPTWLHGRHAARCARDPSAARWLLRAIVDANGVMVGHIGFHDIPQPVGLALADPTFEGDVPARTGDVAEFGYTVFSAHRRRGYATEAACALVEWALGTGEVGGVLATTATENLASQRVVEHAGLEVIGTCREQNGTRELVWYRAQVD